MQSYSVTIRQRRDGLIVARIPSLARAVGYGLDQEEALYELAKALRPMFRKGPDGAAQRSTAPLALAAG